MDERRAYAAVIGQLVLQLRTSRRMNQESLAAKAGLSQSALSRFENGQTLPDAYELRALAVALGYTSHQLTEKIEDAFARTRDVATKVSSGSPWAGIAAGVLAGFAIVGVAAMLDEANKKSGRKKS